MIVRERSGKKVRHHIAFAAFPASTPSSHSSTAYSSPTPTRNKPHQKSAPIKQRGNQPHQPSSLERRQKDVTHIIQTVRVMFVPTILDLVLAVAVRIRDAVRSGNGVRLDPDAGEGTVLETMARAVGLVAA